MIHIFNGTINLYHHWQEIPRFKVFWRWKQYKGTFDIAIILFGHWFGILIDHDIFLKNDEQL